MKSTFGRLRSGHHQSLWRLVPQSIPTVAGVSSVRYEHTISTAWLITQQLQSVSRSPAVSALLGRLWATAARWVEAAEHRPTFAADRCCCSALPGEYRVPLHSSRRSSAGKWSAAVEAASEWSGASVPGRAGARLPNRAKRVNFVHLEAQTLSIKGGVYVCSFRVKSCP